MVLVMNSFEFDNLVKAIESCFKQHYCAMYFEELVEKFCPEVPYDDLSAAINAMYNCDHLILDGTLIRLVVL